MKKIILFSVIFTNFIFSQVYYVSNKGDDNNPGTIEKPFYSVEKARRAANEYKKLNGLKENITIFLREGKYDLNETFRLREEDSGDKNYRIEYKAYPGEKVIITGAKRLKADKFYKLTDKKLLASLPSESRNKILVYDLKKDGIFDYGIHKQIGHSQSVVPSPMELFIDSKMMKLAQYPNDGFILIGEVIDEGSKPRVGDYSERGGIFKYTDERHKRWINAKDLWFQGTFKYGYADDKIKVEYIDTIKKIVKLLQPHLYGIGYGENYNHYVALNLFEEIDSPGEYFIDRENGKLYLYPPYDIKNSDIAVSMLEYPIISFRDASFITLSGLIIEICRGIGVYIEGGEDIRIEGCTVRNIGTCGIFMGQGAKQTFPHITVDDYTGEPISEMIGNLQGHIYNFTTWDRKGGKNHKIISCDIFSTGSGGIYLSGGSKKDLINGNCLVENCKIHDYNNRNKFLWSAVNVDGCGNIVRHNEIYNSDYQGIYVHGNEHIFEYNYIHDVAKNSNDVSAWYIGRDPSDRGNIIRYNYFENIGRPDRKWTMGVYFDDAACDALVESNVFYKTASFGAVYSNAGQDLIIRNNIFIDIFGPALQMKSMWWDFSTEETWDYFFGENGVYRKRLTKLLDIKSEPYKLKYPNLVNWLDLLPDNKTFYGMYPQRNVFENNLMFNCEETTRLVGAYAQFDMRNNYVTHTNPGFIDYKNRNFKLKENSIVFEKIPGFKNIPFEKIGLYGDKYRKIEK